jgi:hypothetical protein
VNEFEVMRKKAKAERADLVSQRNVLDGKISALDKTIEGLDALCEPIPKESPAVVSAAEAMIHQAGITDVVRMALQASGLALSATDIMTLLENISYPLDRFDNPRASINTVLTRLLAAGEVERNDEGDSARYVWIGPKLGYYSLVYTEKGIFSTVINEALARKHQRTASQRLKEPPEIAEAKAEAKINRSLRKSTR